MARIRREELKKDEFVDAFDETLHYVEEHSRALLTLVLVVVLGGGSAGGYYWYTQRQEEQANVALNAALMTFEAPVQEGLPPLPGEGSRKSFSSEQEKYQAAAEEFARVRDDYARTQAALLARHYHAICQYRLGKREAAVKELEGLGRASNREVAARARFTLAGFYQELGRRGEAENLYRQLAEEPTRTVPRAMALLELANLQAETNPAQARQLYEQVKSEFPDSMIATEVSRRLDLLPAAPGPAPAEP